MFTEKLNVLIVEDNERYASLTESKLEENTEHISAEYITSPEDALDIDEHEYDTVIVDYDMPDMDGLEVTEHLNNEYELPVVMFTGCGSEDIATEAFRKGAEDYVCKGSSNAFVELANRVENAALGYRAEEQLGVFKEAVDNAGHAIKITDSSGKIAYVNDSFEKISGYSQEEALGKSPTIVSSGEHDKQFYQDMWETILSGEMWDGEILNETKDGDRYWINQTIRPVEDENGDIKYFIAINKDISREKEEEKFKEVVNSLLRHDAANNQQVMTGRAELALSKLDQMEVDELPEDQQEIYEQARENLQHVDDLIHDNIDLMEDVRNLLGDFDEIDTEPASLKNEVNEAMDKAERLAARNGVDLELDVEDYTITGGPLMDRMIYNPIENSITHPEDHETVRVSSEKVDNDKGDVLLRISDDGEGFPEDFSLEKGVSGENSDSTGIGTWLSTEIADSIGIEMETGESDMGGAEYKFFMEEWD